MILAGTDPEGTGGQWTSNPGRTIIRVFLNCTNLTGLRESEARLQKEAYVTENVSQILPLCGPIRSVQFRKNFIGHTNIRLENSLK